MTTKPMTKIPMTQMMMCACLLLLATACGGGEADLADDGEAVEVATEIEAEWSLTAAQHRERVGDLIAYNCPADGTLGTVWGTDPYTDDSSVCSAGVHAGEITVEDGGRVVIEVLEGLDEYEGGEANGVTTQAYPGWPGSFEVVQTG